MVTTKAKWRLTFLLILALALSMAPSLAHATDRTVWVSRTGSKYHYVKTCSNMKDPIEMTLSDAKAKGKTACSDCVHDSGDDSESSRIPPFSDVYTSTSHNDDISWLYSKKISTGWPAGDLVEFRPYANVARADMAAFLYRLSGSPDYTVPEISPFKDVDAKTPHYKEICWLAEEGISKGWSVSDGKEFRPYATVARCDMAAFLYRAAGSPNYSVPPASPFKDCNDKTPHYKEVCWLASTGISAGWDVSGGKEFRSYNYVTRADMAAFLHRMSDKGLI